MQDIEITTRMVEGVIAGGILILTLISLWTSTHMTALLKTAWQKTIGRHHFLLITKMNLILAEVTPNGGGSMKDALNRIENRQEDLLALNSARMDADHQAIVLTNAKGKVVKISRAFQELTGMSFEQLEGDGWINLIYPPDRDAVLEEWREVVEGQREMNSIQRYQDKHGKPYGVLVKVYRQFDSQKKIRGYLAVVRPEAELKLCPYSVDSKVCSEAFDRELCAKNNNCTPYYSQ